MIRDRQPTVGEIMFELDHPSDEIEFCRNVRNGIFHSWQKPAELWIKSIGTWLRCDGTRAGFVFNGWTHYDMLDRWLLRRAVRRWNKRQDVDILHYIERVQL